MSASTACRVVHLCPNILPKLSWQFFLKLSATTRACSTATVTTYRPPFPTVAPPPSKPPRVLAALCLVRKNTLERQLSGEEQQYASWISERDRVKSLYNNHELKVVALENRVNAIKSKKKMTEQDDLVLRDLERETEDIFEMVTGYEEQAANPGGLENWTQGYADNDLTSLHRCLDQELHLLVNDHELLPESGGHVFPYVELHEGETLRQAAERIVQLQGFGMADVQIASNSPIGYLGTATANSHDIKATDSPFEGVKMFFMKARMADGAAARAAANPTHQWMSALEIKNSYKHSEYLEKVNRFLF